MSKQQSGVGLVNDQISVQGQRVRNQSEPFWSHKSTHENPGTTRENKSSTNTLLKDSRRDEEKQISNENNNEKSSTRWYYQASNNVYQLRKGNQLSTSVSPPVRTQIEFDRSTTAPLILEESIRQTISARIKYSTASRPATSLQTSRLIDSSDSFDNLANSSLFQFQSSLFKGDNQPEIDTNIPITNSYLDLSTDTNPHDETTINDQDEPTTLHRNNQCKMNGFQHIANLGSWQRHSKKRQIEPFRKTKELEYEEDHKKGASKLSYEYKRPFSEEYDHAISLQGQLQLNNSINEWDLKDFYREVKRPFEVETNTKPVFEKCLKLARLQTNTIKWEQRRRQNLNIYNRLMKNPPLDNNLLNLNGSFSLTKNNNEKDYREINELKRELRCNECKRVACLGNCAPGQEYRQYKRFIPFSSLPTTREQIRCKLNLRTQRSTTDLRPRSTQQITRDTKHKFEPNNLTPVVVVPLFEDDLQTKRPQKKLTNHCLPGKSFRSQRREALTLLSSHKILS